MTGWESLDDALQSDSQKFGGAYLNRITQLLSGTNVAAVDATLKPLIGTNWKFLYGNLFLNDANDDNAVQILSDNQTVDTIAKIPTQSYTPDYIVLRKQSEELQNKVIDYNKNTLSNLPTMANVQTYTQSADYYVYIDLDDANKIKAKSMRTGSVTSTHATDAAVPINACYTALTGGGTIMLGRGTFDVYSQLNDGGHSVNLIGSGRGKTIIRRQITTNVQTIYITGSNVTMAYLTVDGNRPTNTSLTSGGETVFIGNNNLVYDAEVKNFGGSSGINNHNWITVDSCVITGYSGSTGYGSYNVLSYTDSVFTRVVNTRMEYGYLNAVFGYGVTIVQNCYMANCGVPAGGMVAMLNPTPKFMGVYGNVFERGLGGDSAVECANCTDGYEVIGNRINNMSGQGITQSPNESCGPIIVKGNIIKNCGGAGICFQGNTQKGLIIEGNFSYDDQGTHTQPYGIVVGHVGAPYTATNADWYVISNNMCWGNVSGGILDLGTGMHKIVGPNLTDK